MFAIKPLMILAGFSWLTHRVNYSLFPQSLMVVCVFDEVPDADTFMAIKRQSLAWINREFKRAGLAVQLKDQQLILDSEMNCLKSHQGNWARRLQVMV